MSDLRKNTRYQTLAKAKIKGVSEGEVLLTDISVTGCRVECTTYSEMMPDIQYKLEVLPESAANIGTFDLLVESKWIRTGNYTCEIGLTIVESPKGKHFQRYVDYLSWRYSQGNSMVKDSGAAPPPEEE